MAGQSSKHLAPSGTCGANMHVWTWLICLTQACNVWMAFISWNIELFTSKTRQNRYYYINFKVCEVQCLSMFLVIDTHKWNRNVKHVDWPKWKMVHAAAGANNQNSKQHDMSHGHGFSMCQLWYMHVISKPSTDTARDYAGRFSNSGADLEFW